MSRNDKIQVVPDNLSTEYYLDRTVQRLLPGSLPRLTYLLSQRPIDMSPW